MESCDYLKNHNIEYCVRGRVSVLSFVGIGGYAPLIVYPRDRCELLCVLSYLSRHGLPYKVVGYMSNILPPDGDWGVCLISTRHIKGYHFDKDRAIFDCGVSLSSLCRLMANRGYLPPVGLCGIPATVGGAVYQNAGAFGCEISDSLIYADIYDPREDRVVRASRDQMKFSYRSSDLRLRGVLLSAAFSLQTGDMQAAAAEMERAIKKRRESQPSGPSLGSVFLRAGEVSAAHYIDCAGLKGYRIGGASVSEKHAGFIINEGGATARDYRTLVAYIQSKVSERFGVQLKTEIEIIEESEGAAWLRFA